jgi:hypothetical protein
MPVGQAADRANREDVPIAPTFQFGEGPTRTSASKEDLHQELEVMIDGVPRNAIQQLSDG